MARQALGPRKPVPSHRVVPRVGPGMEAIVVELAPDRPADRQVRVSHPRRRMAAPLDPLMKLVAGTMGLARLSPIFRGPRPGRCGARAWPL